ncbi:hypothetical protein ACE6H2_016815 [Prunus campanulata]
MGFAGSLRRLVHLFTNECFLLKSSPPSVISEFFFFLKDGLIHSSVHPILKLKVSWFDLCFLLLYSSLLLLPFKTWTRRYEDPH